MIKKFRHKGLRRFFNGGSTAGIQAEHAEKLDYQLAVLNRATEPADMDFPGWQLHPLKGARKGEWTVSVSGNWRLTFEFANGHAINVDYKVYH